MYAILTISRLQAKFLNFMYITDQLDLLSHSLQILVIYYFLSTTFFSFLQKNPSFAFVTKNHTCIVYDHNNYITTYVTYVVKISPNLTIDIFKYTLISSKQLTPTWGMYCIINFLTPIKILKYCKKQLINSISRVIPDQNKLKKHSRPNTRHISPYNNGPKQVLIKPDTCRS